MSHSEIISDSKVIEVLTRERDMLRAELGLANRKLETARGNAGPRQTADIVRALNAHAMKGLGLRLSRNEYITPQEILDLCRSVNP